MQTAATVGAAAATEHEAEKDTPRGCATGSCCSCCGLRSKKGHHTPHGDAAMAPSAPVTLPPSLPSPAFGSNDQLAHQSNGHALGSTPKLPGKSNLKQTSTIPSTSHSGNGSSTLEGKDARFGDLNEGGGERGQGNGERGTKVQWVDNYGKDLTQVFEFEPSSDSDNSDEDDDDCESSQACTCVIQ